MQTSRRHIRNLRRPCCSASALAFNSEAFGALSTLGAFGSSGTEVELLELSIIPSDCIDRAASIRRSKNKDLSSEDGLSTWYLLEKRVDVYYISYSRRFLLNFLGTFKTEIEEVQQAIILFHYWSLEVKRYRVSVIANYIKK